MVWNNTQKLERVRQSLVEMRQQLGWWDDLKAPLDRSILKMDVLMTSQLPISDREVSRFESEREDFHRQALKNLHAKNDRLEIAGKVLKATAVAGIGIPVAFVGGLLAGATLPLVLLAAGAGGAAGGIIGGAAGGAGHLLAAAMEGENNSWGSEWWDMTKEHAQWGALMTGAGVLLKIPAAAILRHPFRFAADQLAVTVALSKSALGWYRANAARRWAPVPVGMGYALLRTGHVARKLRAEQEHLRRRPPDELLKRVRTEPLPFAEGLAMVKRYDHSATLVERVIPQLYAQVTSPEGLLVLSHQLLEIFSMSRTIGAEEKKKYTDLLEEEFQRGLEAYGKWALTLKTTGAAESPVALFQFDRDQDGQADLIIEGNVARPGIKDFIRELQAEKEILLGLEGINPERRAYIDRAIPLEWGKIQAKIADLPVTLENVKKAFSQMGEDFVAKNPDIWDAFRGESSDVLGSPGGLVGFFGAALFVRGNGLFYYLKGIPFALAGSWIWASHQVEAIARRREPVFLCVPGYGNLCEEPQLLR